MTAALAAILAALATPPSSGHVTVDGSPGDAADVSFTCTAGPAGLDRACAVTVVTARSVTRGRLTLDHGRVVWFGDASDLVWGDRVQAHVTAGSASTSPTCVALDARHLSCRDAVGHTVPVQLF